MRPWSKETKREDICKPERGARLDGPGSRRPNTSGVSLCGEGTKFTIGSLFFKSAMRLAQRNVRKTGTSALSVKMRVLVSPGLERRGRNWQTPLHQRWEV